MIKIEAVTKQYRSGKGIFDVSFSVEEGEVFGYLGPNGAGKTTTIRVLMGFLKADQGRSWVRGFDSWRNPENIHEDLGYIAGEIAFFDDMDGREFLDFMHHMRGTKDRRLEKKLLERFELDPHNRIKRMSKGMKQKLGVVAAFMHNPSVYILDEPTSGLDPLMQNEFIHLVKEEKEVGKTFLISSHSFTEIERTSDRAGVIREGRLVAVENVVDLKAKHQKTYSVTVGKDADLQTLRQSGLSLGRISNHTVEVVVGDEYSQFLSVLNRCTVTDLDVVAQGLEQAFLKYYGEVEPDESRIVESQH